MKKWLLAILIALSALSISTSAAFFSIIGLSKLFAGAATAVIIMGSALEVSKLVIASLLYQYRKTLPKLLKIYLTVACVILISITSIGIYGFLSGAYKTTSDKMSIVDKEINLINLKKERFNEQLLFLNQEKSQLNQDISSLREGLTNNKIQYTDVNGNLISTTSSANRKTFEKQLETTIERKNQVDSKIETTTDSITKFEIEILNIESTNDLAAELGPLQYLSDITGKSMDNIINYLLLLIVIVFDPLAISLVVAANFAFNQIKPKEEIVEEVDYKEIQKKVFNKVEELRKEGKLPEINEYDDKNEPSALANSQYRLEETIEEEEKPTENFGIQENISYNQPQEIIQSTERPKAKNFIKGRKADDNTIEYN
jgi:hypothetical protein